MLLGNRCGENMRRVIENFLADRVRPVLRVVGLWMRWIALKLRVRTDAR
jgi:hypothetical protein